MKSKILNLIKTILAIALLSALVVSIGFYITERQIKITESIVIGDTVSFSGVKGEVIGKTKDGNFIIKTEVPAMRITKE